MTNNNIQIDKFDGEGFSLWSIKMEMVLKGLGIWSIVIDSDSKPDPSQKEDYKLYMRKDEQAHSAYLS